MVKSTSISMSYSLYFINDDLRTSSWFTSFTRFSGDVLMVFSWNAVERLLRRIKISDTMRCIWILLVLMWVLTHAVIAAIWMPSIEMLVFDLCKYFSQLPWNYMSGIYGKWKGTCKNFKECQSFIFLFLTCILRCSRHCDWSMSSCLCNFRLSKILPVLMSWWCQTYMEIFWGGTLDCNYLCFKLCHLIIGLHQFLFVISEKTVWFR